VVKKILKRAITVIATTTLTIGLIGACTLREEEHNMEQCTGTIYTLRTAILYPLIDSFPYLRVFATDAQVVDGTPEAEVRVEWDEGVNRPANLKETLKLGESATLEKVGTFTLIGMEPPARGKRWPDPVVCFEQDPQLMDTARQYAADNDLLFPSDEQDSQS
jgi:lipoprotein